MREPKMLGRPREFDEDEALAKIMNVFWAKGFEGASMSDLVSATGLRKGSLYAAFGDKRAIYRKALALYDRTAIDRAVRLLAGPAAPDSRTGAGGPGSTAHRRRRTATYMRSRGRPGPQR